MDVVSPAEIEGALLGYLDGLLEALGYKDGMEEIEGKPLGMSLRMLDGSCDDIPEGLKLGTCDNDGSDEDDGITDEASDG
mmetsp:Transcript_31666/g.48121  ORF Transcript_31666/g.48121 Transcript_31666/m.48121 type:complete len:80 (+) Transcript_31666:493-732(+)